MEEDDLNTQDASFNRDVQVDGRMDVMVMPRSIRCANRRILNVSGIGEEYIYH